MVDGPGNKKNIPGFNAVQKVGFAPKSTSIKDAIGGFWNTIDTSIEEKEVSSPDNIQSQINKIKKETTMLKSMLKPSGGSSLNLIG